VPTVEFIEPTISNAAADAGRPKPSIIAVVPALVSDDVDAAHAVAAQQLSFYETIPSHQKVIAREGVASAADLAAIGPPHRRWQHTHYLNRAAAVAARGAFASSLLWFDRVVADDDSKR
jgi:hypothetical protein